MALTGYAAGSPQAPQTGLPGGALVTTGGSVPNLVYDNLSGAGQASQANPSLFQNLMNMLGGIPGGAQALRYGPGAATAVGAFGQGDIAGGIGAAAATVAAGRGMKALAERAPNMNPLLRGGLELGGSLLASNIGAQLGHGVAAAGNQLFGGAQAAVGDVTRTLAGAQRESGQAAGTGTQPGVPTDQAMARQLQMLRMAGVNIPNEYLTQNYQILQKYKNDDVTRQMQMNQQQAQLMGQLNQQIISGQLASGAQQQAGATTRDILTSNPYQASVLNTGAVRGI
jgi:hypothetical protein